MSRQKFFLYISFLFKRNLFTKIDSNHDGFRKFRPIFFYLSILIVDIWIKNILLYIYLLLLCFQLDHPQRINYHHHRYQFILAGIKQRATMFFNGQVLTLYTTFWLTAVTYRILQHLLHQLRHYAPHSTTIIITITVIMIIPLTILAITAIMIIITIVGHQIIFIHITLTWHIIINSIILLRCIIITITQILW